MSLSSGPSCRYHPAEKYVGYGHAKSYEENDERGLYRIVHRHGHLPGGIVTALTGYLRQLPFNSSRRDRYLGMTAAIPQVPVPTAISCPHGYF